MPVRLCSRALLGIVLAGALACGPSVNLATDLEITDVSTGWYDAGLNDAGWNHLVPSISFRLENVADHEIAGVQLTVSVWLEGDDGEVASKVVRGIGSEALAPGATTDPIVVRTEWGYNLEGARATLFDHSSFRDGTAKIFGQRGGRIVPLGEFKIERKLIYPSSGPGRP